MGPYGEHTVPIGGTQGPMGSIWNLLGVHGALWGENEAYRGHVGLYGEHRAYRGHRTYRGTGSPMGGDRGAYRGHTGCIGGKGHPMGGHTRDAKGIGAIGHPIWAHGAYRV